MKTVINMLILLAIVLQGFIPLGYMPSVQGDKVAVVICSGTGGTKTVYLDQDQAPASEDTQHEETTSACPYQLAQSPFVLESPVLEFQKSEIKSFEQVSKEDDVVAFILTHSYQSRGPPSSFL